MKKILLSVRPKYCELIFNGKKTIEVRRNRPKLEPPFEVLVYQTKIRFKVRDWQENFQSIIFTPNGGVEDGNGKVIGSFVCDKIDEFSVGSLASDDIQNEACLTYAELISYFYKQNELDGNTLKFGYGWHITAPKLFDKPKELSEFGTVCNRYENDECDDCPYLQVYVNSYPCDDCVDTWCGVDNIKPLTRPPQSWCYVEEI